MISHGEQHGDHHGDRRYSHAHAYRSWKPVLIFLLSLAGLALMISGITSYWGRTETGTSRSIMRAFDSCARPNADVTDSCTWWRDQNSVCAELVDTVHAGASLGVIAIVVLFLSLIYNFFRYRAGKTVNAVFLALVLLCGLVSWAIFFAVYDSDFCDTSISNGPGAEIGPMAPLMLIGWLFVLVAFALELSRKEDAPFFWYSAVPTQSAGGHVSDEVPVYNTAGQQNYMPGTAPAYNTGMGRDERVDVAVRR